MANLPKEFKKETLYQVDMFDGIDSFVGQYELTTAEGFLCFTNHNTYQYGYLDPDRVFQIKEIESV